MVTMPERDWKRMRSLEARALDDACARVFDRVESMLTQREGGNHKTYLALWNLLREENDVIADLFDDMRRSRALFKLAGWSWHGLISERELSLFTAETQNAVRTINEIER